MATSKSRVYGKVAETSSRPSLRRFLNPISVWASVAPLVEFKRRTSDGMSVQKALALTVAEETAFNLMPVPMMMAYMGPALVDAGFQVGQMQGEAYSKAYKSNFGGHYFDTQNNYTMRQASVNAIQQSRMNTRSVLGSEARRVQR